MSTATAVEKLYLKGGPLTIGEAAQRLGLHPERVRRHVHEPYYRRVDCEWAVRRWVWRWAWVKERCDCGAPAWFIGRALMHYERSARVETWLLCGRCAADADKGMEVEPLYGAVDRVA